jgi:biotin carboxyl carrier protein
MAAGDLWVKRGQVQTMQLTLRHRGSAVPVHLDIHQERPGRLVVKLDGQPHEVEAEILHPSILHLVVDGEPHTARVARIGQEIHVFLEGAVYVFSTETDGAAETHGGTLAPPQIVAPMPGKVLHVLVTEGQQIGEGGALLILEAMKMETRIVAEAPGRVTRVHVADGQMVEGGAVLIELEYLSG